MTVESNASRDSYNCNGSQTEFPYTFRILDESHLKVLLRDSDGNETVLTLTTHYTVDGVGEDEGGNVTTVATYASGYTLIILRNVPVEQLTDYVENDPFAADSHEDALDKATMILQQLKEEQGRCFKVPLSSPISGSDLELNPVASMAIGWDAAAAALTTMSPTPLYVVDFVNLHETYDDDVSAAIAAIGAAHVTVVVDRNTDEIAADVTSPSNIDWLPINGAMFDVAASKTFTVFSPSNILAHVTRQIKTGAGSLVFSQPGVVSPCWFGFSVDATGANNVSYFNEASTNPSGTVIEIPNGAYDIDTTFASMNLVDNNQEIRAQSFGGVTLNVVTGANNPVIVVNSTCTTTDKTKMKTDLRIAGLIIDHVDESSVNTCVGIDVRDVRRVIIENCRFIDLYKGIKLNGARDNITIRKCSFYDIGYGITVESYFVAPETPLTLQDSVIENCYFSDVNDWAIYVGYRVNTIRFNGLSINVGDTAAGQGIYVITGDADTGTQYNGNLRFSNIAFETLSAGKQCFFFEDPNTTILHNVVLENIFMGDADCYGITAERVQSMTLNNVWFYQNGTAPGQAYNFDANCHNILMNNCRYHDETNMPARVSAMTEPIHQVPALVYVDTVHSSSGTGEDTIFTYTIRKQSMQAYGGFRFIARGVNVYSNGNKTIKVYWGSTAYTVHAAANNTDDWELEVLIWSAEATNAQRVYYRFIRNTGGSVVITRARAAATEDTDAGDVIFKVTGECAHASDVIRIEFATLEAFCNMT